MPAPTRTRRVSFRRILGRPWWQGVAVVVTLLIFIIPIWITSYKPEDKPAPPSQEIKGNCNAQGSQNNVSCQILPQPEARGRVTLKALGGIYALYSGPPSTLPTPPDYPADRVTTHCEDWSDWFTSMRDLYRINPVVYVELETGEADLVVLTSVKATIYRRTPITGGTLIQCVYGGGGIEGYYVTVDTVKGKTTYTRPDDTDKVFEMPPSAIESRKLEYQGVFISLDSQEGQFYEGSITIQYTINGKSAEYSVGTRDQPLRWVTDRDQNVADSYPQIFDWHPTRKRWIANFDHFNLSG